MKKKTLLESLTLLVIAILIALSLGGCGSKESQEAPAETPAQGQLTTGNITEENLAQVTEILETAGLSNIDVFKKWVKEMNAANAENAETDQSGFTDADCRMTVMLLTGDLIKYDSLEENYTGDYLMFDLDAIENNPEFDLLKEKKNLFTTIFGEMPIEPGNDPAEAFNQALHNQWEKHGIQLESEKNAIISLVFKAYEADQAFVGHTGVLVDCRDNEGVPSNYIFVEKIAFSEPFVLTLVDSETELIDVLSKRPDYSVEEGEPNPAVYKNGELIGELKS